MKQNILFAVLTAVVLAIGFYSMNLIEIFNDEPYCDSITTVGRTEKTEVYISSIDKKIDPMELIEPCDYDESPENNVEARSIATSVIKAMSRYDNRITIEWGIRDQLFNSWKISKNGYIYLDKWQYISLNQTERLLDCIVDMKDYSIVYIRFYNNDDRVPTSNAMYSGLDKLSMEAEEFYPQIIDLEENIKDEMLSYAENKTAFDESVVKRFMNLFNWEACSPWEHNSMLLRYIERYNDMKDAVSCVTNSSTASFWLSPVPLEFMVTDHKAYMYNQELTSETRSITVQNVLKRFTSEEYQWTEPSYSASGGRIYQTIPIGDDELTVIYSVKEDLIEGYYYNY